MKDSSSYLLRALYIILVPIVLLIILLNSGWLQRLLPAATVNGETYQVTRYNFYYFDYYIAFLEENEDRLDDLGYDPQLSDADQSYDGTISWKEYFQLQAEADLAETAYYCDLAEAAGYQFSEEELAPVAERLAENEADRLLYGISANNYYVSYYGSGVSEARFEQELTRKVQAQAYKAHLLTTYEAEQEATALWLAENPQEDYRVVDLQVITLDALADRETGQVEAAGLEALAEKLDKLAGRYDGDASFEALQQAFSSCALGDGDGVLTGASSADLPEVLADWCLNDQDRLRTGDTYTCIDPDTGTAYFAVFQGLGVSGQEEAARLILGLQAIEETEQETLETTYQVERNRFGMLLATS